MIGIEVKRRGKPPGNFKIVSFGVFQIEDGILCDQEDTSGSEREESSHCSLEL